MFERLMLIFWYILPVVILVLAQFLINAVPKIKQSKIKNIDIATFFMVIGLHELSVHTFSRSIFPFWLIVAMLLAMGAGAYLAYSQQKVELKKLLKIFWRLTFLMTITMYVIFIVLNLIIG